MSYILSIFVFEPFQSLVEQLQSLETGSITLGIIADDSGSGWRAGYKEALWYRLGGRYDACGFYILTDTGGGYLSSSPFAEFPEGDNLPVCLCFSPEAESILLQILELCLRASRAGTIAIMFEPTFSVVDDRNGRPVSSEDLIQKYKTFNVAGPMHLDEFWDYERSGGMIEEIICLVSLEGQSDLIMNRTAE